MIGTEKLSAIRKQIERALASPGADPVQRLERQIASARRKGDRTEVLEGLKQFLESPGKRKHGKRGVGAKDLIATGQPGARAQRELAGAGLLACGHLGG